MQIHTVLHVLFLSVIFFVVANTLLSYLLWKFNGNKVYALTFRFWLYNILYLCLQFFYPQTKNEIVLVYGFGMLPLYITYTIVCEILKIQAKVKPFLASAIINTVLTLVLLHFNAPFTIAALPFAVALALPIIFAIKNIFIDYRHQSSMLEKILGGILVVWVIHCFNFPLFRMEADAPLYGWITTYALYDLMAIILPATVIANLAKTEKERLNQLVLERTNQLSAVLADKETLLKILIHDISNPLTVMRWYLTGVKKAEDPSKYIEKITKSQDIVEDIVRKVKALQSGPQSQKLTPVSMLKCIAEMSFVFEKHLEEKQVKLKVIDDTQGDDLFLADPFTFTHSILSNFISNAIKFSPSRGEITLHLSRNFGVLQLIIKDQGAGMSQEMRHSLLSDTTISSTPGTQGELGTGLGIGIARNLLTHFNGDFKIEAKEILHHPSDHGTSIILTFPALPVL